VTRVALGHHVSRLKNGAGNLGNRKSLVEGLLGGNNGSIGCEHKVDTRIRHQVGLELGDINVQGTIETKRGGQRTDNLSDQTVQVGVRRTFNVKVAAADIVQGLVIEAESAVSVLQEGVGGEHRVVGLYNGGRNLRRRGDSKRKFRLASVVNRETLQEERSKSRSGTSTGCVENKETLKTGAVIRELSDAVQDKVNNLLSDSVVTTGVVVGSVFLAVDDLLGVVELGVGSSTDFVANSGFQIDVDGTRDMLARLSLAEEGVEGVIGNTDRAIGGHVTIRSDAMLEAVQLPALVTGLDTGLTEVDRDTFCDGTRQR
jgi:hypothetical protein